MKLTKQSDSF